VSTEENKALVRSYYEQVVNTGAIEAIPNYLSPEYVEVRENKRSKTRWYRAVYDVVGPFYPVVRRLFPRYVTTTVELGRALIQVAATGYPARILYTPDIHRLALAAAGAG